MHKDLQKNKKYTKDLAVRFLGLCRLGKTMTEISNELDVLPEELHRWSGDRKKTEFQNAWAKGKIACQAFHEAKLQTLISEGESGVAKSQMDFMAVLFADWDKKQESKITIENKTEKMSNEELYQEFVKVTGKSQVKNLLNSVGKPEKKLKLVKKVNNDA